MIPKFIYLFWRPQLNLFLLNCILYNSLTLMFNRNLPETEIPLSCWQHPPLDKANIFVAILIFFLSYILLVFLPFSFLPSFSHLLPLYLSLSPNNKFITKPLWHSFPNNSRICPLLILFLATILVRDTAIFLLDYCNNHLSVPLSSPLVLHPLPTIPNFRVNFPYSK